MQEKPRRSNKSAAEFSHSTSQRTGGSNTARRVSVGTVAAIAGAAIGASLVWNGLFAGPAGSVAERTGQGPAVVELFTSQGCYSCPPAEKLLGKLIKDNPDLIALEFHVDYWDSLVYGSHGSHKDPFSDKENTFRQQLYNRLNLAGIEVLDRPFVDLAVTHDTASDIDSGSSGIRIELSGEHSQVPDSAHLWVAVFDIEKTTEITTGENHDKTLTSHHIVRQFDQLTPDDGFAALVSSDSTLELKHQLELKEGQGCAVLLQEVSLGPIYGAAYCPDTVWKRAT